LVRLDRGAGPLYWFTMGVRALGELPCLIWQHSLAKWPVFPQLKHGNPVGVNSCGGQTNACCCGVVRAHMYCYCS
jgi:hypothetical protein